ncbi:hypothetical protein [Cochleicola gelatinilyticus]|uniref:hypothetical protein n=1 Tax=Cochleicola gelatinilyticus TaxID=1763537 RepID=UPI0012FC916B|nr:hypothetical protein [Cochleicola gelatinilyticus]
MEVKSKSRSLLYLSSETKEYEVYVDENNLYYDGILLDSERIKHLDISQKKKDSISAI